MFDFAFWLTIAAIVLVLAAIVGVALLIFYNVKAVRRFYRDAETLFLPAAQALGSFVVGALGLMNWSPLTAAVNASGFTVQQLVGLMVVSFVQALVLYGIRKARDPQMQGPKPDLEE